jgi:hypothetical protein
MFANLNFDADGLADVVEHTSQALLPNFVRARYHVGVEVNALDEWDENGRIRLELNTRGDEDITSPIDQVASGYRLWLQLALMEAAESVRAYAALLERAGTAPLPDLDDANYIPGSKETGGEGHQVSETS